MYSGFWCIIGVRGVGKLCVSKVGRMNLNLMQHSWVHPRAVPCKQARRGHCSLSWGKCVPA